MKYAAIVAMLLLHAGPVYAQRPLQQVLFDFEEGIDGWTTNVWGGGGTVTLRASEEPKFGSVALHSNVASVEKGGNTISPWLPMDADWREHDWGAISLWFKGDGTPTKASLRVHGGAHHPPGDAVRDAPSRRRAFRVVAGGRQTRL